MSSAEFVMQLARGEPCEADRLLRACRLEAGGSEACGSDAVIAAFRRTPLPLNASDDRIESDSHLALFHHHRSGEASALFADLYDGNVGRLWLLSPEVADAERQVSVPFDAGMGLEQTDDVCFSTLEHPQLDAAAARHLSKVVGDLARTGDAGERSRYFVVRAFSNCNRGAALIARFEAARNPDRVALFSYAGVSLRYSGECLLQCQIVSEARANTPNPTFQWMPRI